MQRRTALLSIAVAIAICGCSESNSNGIASVGSGVTVIYESNPLADVQVRLHASPTGPILTQAISAADGLARFAEIPDPEPNEYFVSLASLSDGGWILDAKYSNAADSGVTLQPIAKTEGQRIELPPEAIHSLIPIVRGR